MISVIHEEFVKSIRRSILDKDMAVLKLEKDKVVSIISDILCLGREAVYRRLRGEVKFSLEEIALIALKLDISIDSLIGLKNKEKSLIGLNLVDVDKDFREKYFDKLKEQTALFESVSSKYNDTHVLAAFNRIPYTLYLHYDSIAKFRLFKWAYQMNLIQDVSFKELIIPKEVVQAQAKLVSVVRKLKETSLILSPDVLAALMADIQYFYDMHLLDEEDVASIKEQLNDLLTDLEGFAISGEFEANAKIRLYISDLGLNFSNMVFRYGKHSYTYINLYDIGGIDSQNEKLCEYQTLWIKSQKRYRKLITQSNEIERRRFFRQQRDYINGE